MKNYTMFNYSFLFNDHFAKVSNQAKLYYIKLNFFADKGFVPNPMMLLDSLGFDKSVFWELKNNDEILTLPDRSEIFITSYFVHNPRFDIREWYKSPFSVYWKGKLKVKMNRVATFNPNGLDKEMPLPQDLANIQPPIKNDVEKTDEWDKIMEDLAKNGGNGNE